MITKKDVQALERTFATKTELKAEILRLEGVMVDNFKTVIEMIGDVSEKLEPLTDLQDTVNNHERRIERLEVAT